MHCPGTTASASAAALAALLFLCVPGSIRGQESGGDSDGGTARPAVSPIGEAFFGGENVARIRDRLHGRTLAEDAAERARRSRDRSELGAGFRPPLPGVDDRRRPDRDEEDRARRKRPRGRRFFHPSGGRFIVVQPVPVRSRVQRPEEYRARTRAPRAVRRPDVRPTRSSEAREEGEARRSGAGAPTATAGQIGRHLRERSGRGSGGADAACVRLHLETPSGIGFEARVDPIALDAEGPGDVGRLLRLKIDEGEPLVLPLVDGEEMEFPAGAIDAVVAGPCD